MNGSKKLEKGLKLLLEVPNDALSNIFVTQIFSAMDQSPFSSGKIKLEKWAVQKIGNNFILISKEARNAELKALGREIINIGLKKEVEIEVKGHFGRKIVKVMERFNLTNHKLINKL